MNVMDELNDKHSELSEVKREVSELVIEWKREYMEMMRQARGVRGDKEIGEVER